MTGMRQRYLHTLARCHLRASRSPAVGLAAAAGGASPLPTVIDKTRYSAFAEPTLIVSTPGADVCVLTTVRDAVDVGYRVMSCATRYGARSDEGHDMLMRLYHTRYTENTETADATTFCADAMLLNRCILSSRLMRSRTAREPTCSM
jgi:hypothetical protein